MRYPWQRGPREDEREILLVDHGEVTCPRRGNADIEQCFVCGWMVEHDFDAAQPNLRCVARVEPGLADRIAYLR